MNNNDSINGKVNIDAKELWGDENPFDVSALFHSCLGWASCPGLGQIVRLTAANFGGFKDLRTIELGCGEGKVSLLFSLLGAKTSLVDYSAKQIERARLLAENFDVEPIIINEDILDFAQHHRKQYDVSMSFGTAEHFFGKSRQKVINAHYGVLKKGGMSFIWVPNRYGVLFRLGVFFRKAFQRPVCPVDEIPFTRKELVILAKTAGYQRIFVTGGTYLKNDFSNYVINEQRLLRRSSRREKFWNAHKARNELVDCMSKNRPSQNPIGNFFSYALLLCCQRV